MTPNRTLLWVSFVLLTSAVFGQSKYLNSPVSAGRGGTGVASNESWSSILNPATISKAENSSLSVSYYLPYFINELSSKSALGILPFKYGVLSTYVNQYGFSLYQENGFGLSYTRNIVPNLHASLQFNYKNISLSQSGSGGQLYAGIGLLYEPSETVALGLYISNPERSDISIQSEISKIPSLFILGFNWFVSSDFNLSGEVEKEDGFGVLYKLGLEYDIQNKIWIRTGVLGKPINYTFGLGFDVVGFRLDAGMIFHQVLGTSSCFGISYTFKQK